VLLFQVFVAFGGYFDEFGSFFDIQAMNQIVKDTLVIL
jgi:hypothetical protein